MSHSRSEDELPRKFGLSTATYIVLASMIGSGILVSPGFMLWSLQSYSWSFMLWILGGFMAVCGAFCVGEMAAAMPRAGGEYVYLREAMGPLPAFLSGWTSFIMGFAAPIAVNAHVCATYLLSSLGGGPESIPSILAVKLVAASLVLAVSIPNMFGHKESAIMQQGTTWIKGGCYLALIFMAAFFGQWREPLNLETQPPNHPAISILLTQLYFVLFAYLGWNASTYVAGEIKSPEKNLPRSLLLGIGLVMLVYIGVNGVIALALPPDAISNPSDAERVLYLAVDRLFGSAWAGSLSLLIGLTFLASISAYVVTGPRVYYAMAKDGLFPAMAGDLHKKSSIPVKSTWMQSALALAILFLFNLESLYQYTAFGLSCFSMLIIASSILLRIKRKDMVRPYRMPLYPLPALIYLVISLFMAFHAFREWTQPSLISLLSILAGIPIYFYFIRRNHLIARDL